MAERIIPFAVSFAEPVAEDDIIDATGEYDGKTQIWKLKGKGDSSSMVMSFPQPERPPTTCSRMTKITYNTWRTDTVVDD